MELATLFKELADVFDGSRPIETHARDALLNADTRAPNHGPHVPLPDAFRFQAPFSVKPPV